MKKGWEIKKLEEITTKLGDGLHGTPKYKENGDYYFINGNNLNNGKIVLKENTKRVSFLEFDKYKKELNERTILVSINGTLGNIAFYNDEKIILGKSACYFNLKHSIEKQYIKYIIQSPYFIQYAHKEATGATIKNVSLKTMRNFTVPLPSQNEQKHIVSILDRAFKAIDKAKANAEQNLINAKQLFESYLQGVLADKKWNKVKLSEVCNKVEYGSSSKSKEEGVIPVLRMGNIQNGRFTWDNLKYSDNKEDNDKYLLKYNDVLFNRTNSPEWIGKTAIYKSEMPAIFAGYLIRIYRKEDLLDADYLNYYLNSQMARDYGDTVVISSVNQANINGTKLKTYPIPLPSIKEQKQIVQKLDKLSAETKKLEAIYQQKIKDLEELKKSVLQRAFNGELLIVNDKLTTNH